MNKFISLAIIFGTLQMATPLILAALGGVFSEKAGVVNIALEGIILVGAFFSVLATYYSQSPWIGVLAAVISGALLASVHAVVSIKFKANQVVSGTAINILATGLTTFLMVVLFNTKGTFDGGSKLNEWTIPGTNYSLTPLVFITGILVILSWVLFYKTPLGLRIRAVGEHPHAADTVGVNIYNIRYFAVIMSGVLAGLGGAQLAIGEGTVFVDGMSSGRGFIALAAMIFGRWHPIGAAGAALLFGYFDKIQTNLKLFSASGNSSFVEIAGMTIPTDVISMIPYLMTIVVLAGVMGKATAPAASGIAYEKGKR